MSTLPAGIGWLWLIAVLAIPSGVVTAAPRIYSADKLVLGDHDANKADWISENEVVFLGYRVMPDASVPHTGMRVGAAFKAG